MNLLTSLALIFLCGLALGGLFEKVKLPPLLGMLLTGILLGPSVLNLLDWSVVAISSDLRKVALVIILIRAGLSLDLKELKKVGRPALLLCFVPACFEILGMVALAPLVLGVSYLDAAVIGTVIAAVSPAVIVPKMLRLMDQKVGTGKSIPQMLLAGASVDDVFVIVLFTSFTGLAQGEALSLTSLLQIPLSVISGGLAGALLGAVLAWLFHTIHMRDSAKVLVILSVALLLTALENHSPIPFSGLLAVMSLGIVLQKMRGQTAVRLSGKFSKLWVGAELLLFALVGAAVDISYAASAGILMVVVLLGALLFRMAGVFLCLLGTPLNKKERLFCMIAYTPKATVQAAIGSLPLSMGLSCGTLALTAAVLAILITAPLGAALIDLTAPRLLENNGRNGVKQDKIMPAQ